jgi:hypothetical protein
MCLIGNFDPSTFFFGDKQFEQNRFVTNTLQLHLNHFH